MVSDAVVAVTPHEPLSLLPTPEPAKGGRPAKHGATIPTSIRIPTVMKAAALDLCDRFPHQFSCLNDVYVTALKKFLEEAQTGETDAMLAALGPCRAVRDFELMQHIVLEGVSQTVTMVTDAVARGMTERAHEIYGLQMTHFLTCRDLDWRKEGIRLLEAQVRPLLPRRSALTLRMVSKKSE